jgi:GSH-dependent disulfide-bond oxidoreductase
MIEFYTWATPNCRKVSIMLEEVGLPYHVHTVDISKGDQFKPEFVAISPNSKIPVITDPDMPGDGGPMPIFESGAILIHLAEKTGRFLSTDPTVRIVTIEWLMFQMANVGPMFGQAHHFRRFAPEPVPYAIERYTKETARLYGVLELRLGEAEYLAGDYSIADMATYPWVARHEWQGIDLEELRNVKRWFDTVAARPAVQRGMQVPKI